MTWVLANDAPGLALRIVASCWRWFQQRGRLREGRALLAELLAGPLDDARLRIAGLAGRPASGRAGRDESGRLGFARLGRRVTDPGAG